VILSTQTTSQDTVISEQNNTGFIPLTGVLPSVVANQGKPYLVTSNIEVAEGQTVKIEKGVIFLFKNFTGLNVKGSISVDGEKNIPVIFTSENNPRYNPGYIIDPAPFDWDGINLATENTKQIFTYTVIEYSLYGIKSLTDNIILKECTFKHNGNADFTINGQKQVITSTLYTYIPDKKVQQFQKKNNTDSIKSIYTVTDNNGKKVFEDIKLTTDSSDLPLFGTKPDRKGVRVTFGLLGLCTAIAGGVYGTIELKKWNDAKKEFDELSNVTHEQKIERNIAKKWEDAQNRVNYHFIRSTVSYSAGLAGFITLIITISF